MARRTLDPFGPLPPSVVQRISAAPEADLNRWAERLVLVDTPDDVLAG